MTMAPRVRADKAHMIPAAVHIDGTARIQTVDRASNPRFYGVIEEFAKLTGVPVVLNTSFNFQEPIVGRRMPSPVTCVRRWMFWCWAIFTSSIEAPLVIEPDANVRRRPLGRNLPVATSLGRHSSRGAFFATASAW